MNDLYDHVPIEILPLYSDPSLSQCVECNSINFPNHVLYDLVTDSQVMLSNDWHTASFSCVKHKITHGLWLTPPYMQDDKSDAPLPIHYDFHFTMCMISLPSTVQLFLHYMTQQTSLCCMLHTLHEITSMWLTKPFTILLPWFFFQCIVPSLLFNNKEKPCLSYFKNV